MPNNEITIFAETNFRNQHVRFGIKRDDRRRHTYIIGKTGMGKSVLMENMAISDIMAGEGVAFLDPHGEGAEKLLDYVPANRINDVIYFNPSDRDWPIAFNVMEAVDSRYRPLVASGMIGVFQKIWADSWGPRLEYVLRNAILALLEYPGSTILGIMRILTDKEFRKKVVEKLTDPVVRSFWVDEFAKYPDKFATEAVAPIQNKVGQFISNPVARNIVGQTKSKIDLREIMDNKKILIMNLTKGGIGEDVSHLLGAMMITKIQLAAMSRIDTAEEDRSDFFLYVDEFQNFATDSFATILSEARKYRLSLIMGHQYIAQLNEMVRDAVFGNVGTIITFRVGAVDAEFLEKEFEPNFMMNDIVNLPKWNIYLKLMIDGVSRDPFSASTLPPPPKPEKSNKETIIKISRERYATRREIIEEKIARWSGFGTEDEEGHPITATVSNLKPRYDKPRNDGLPTFSAQCWACDKNIEVPFQPDGIRPVYCPDCLKKVRAGEISEVALVQKRRALAAQTAVSAAPAAKEPAVMPATVKEPMVSVGVAAKSAGDYSAAPSHVAAVGQTPPPTVPMSNLLNQKPTPFKGGGK